MTYFDGETRLELVSIFTSSFSTPKKQANDYECQTNILNHSDKSVPHVSLFFFWHKSSYNYICIFSACLDTSETGNLASCKLMGEFSEDPLKNFDYITASDQTSYSFNVHSDGNILEIVSIGCKY